MSAFSIFVLVLAGAGAVFGFSRGLIAQVGQILALVGGIMACRLFGPSVVAYFSGSAPSPATDTALAYAITFLVAYFAIWIVVRLIRGVVKGVRLGLLDRLAGAVFKAGLWLFLFSIVLNVWAAIPTHTDITDTRLHPRRAYILKIAPAVCGYVMERAAVNSHID